MHLSRTTTINPSCHHVHTRSKVNKQAAACPTLKDLLKPSLVEAVPKPRLLSKVWWKRSLKAMRRPNANVVSKYSRIKIEEVSTQTSR